MFNQYLDIAPEVKKALEDGKPVVALESTIISHGMPYPQNVETALEVERIIKEEGCTPATIAIIGGRLKAGLSQEEITYLGKKGQEITKVSRRDLPVVCALKKDGATTVATTMMIASLANIPFFATGGIGGVHRGATETMDISADLLELAQTPVGVICAGAKAILDLKLTLEYLETNGVPILGYQTSELPAFFSRESGLKVDYRVNSPLEIAKIYLAEREVGMKTGLLITNPVPKEYALDSKEINEVIEKAIVEANQNGIVGKEITPFLLAKIKTLTKGESLKTNIALVYNNACLAAKIAKSYCELIKK